MRARMAAVGLLLALSAAGHPAEPLSPGKLTIGLSETRFHPTAGTFRCAVTGTRLAQNPDSVSVFVNDRPLDLASVHPSDKGIRVDYRFRPGLNEVLVEALDRDGLRLRADALLWAGATGLLVHVSDAENRPVDDAKVTIALNEQNAVRFVGRTTEGNLFVPNLPPQPLTIEVRRGRLAARQVADAAAGYIGIRLGSDAN